MKENTREEMCTSTCRSLALLNTATAVPPDQLAMLVAQE